MKTVLKNILSNKKLIREIFLYCVIGFTSSLMDSFFYFIFTRHLYFNEFISNFISVNIGITISFILNTFINFRKTNKIFKRAFSFYSVGYLGLIISMFILYCGISILDIYDMAVKIISIFIVAAFQYILNKIITYGKIK